MKDKQRNKLKMKNKPAKMEKQARNKIIDESIKIFMIAVVHTLWYHQGWGTVRLWRFIKQMEKTTNLLVSDPDKVLLCREEIHSETGIRYDKNTGIWTCDKELTKREMELIDRKF